MVAAKFGWDIAANQALIDDVRALAAAREATPAQVALAWLLAQQPSIDPFPAGAAATSTPGARHRRLRFPGPRRRITGCFESSSSSIRSDLSWLEAHACPANHAGRIN